MERLREGATRILRFAESLQHAAAWSAAALIATELEVPVTTSRRDVRRRATRGRRRASSSAIDDASRARRLRGRTRSASGHPPDLVVFPATPPEIAAIARLCNEHRVPLVVRGAGTGYTGGAVPTRGGVVAVDRAAEPHPRDRRGQSARRRRAERHHRRSAARGRARRAVLSARSREPRVVVDRRQRRRVRRRAARVQVRHDEALRARRSRRCCRPARSSAPASKAVKNVVGYDLTQLLVGSEGTLAIITQITLRLIPKPPARATLSRRVADVDGRGGRR